VAQRQRQFVDAPFLIRLFQNRVANSRVGWPLGREAEAVGVVGQAVHDVGDRQLARATHHAVVAGGAHEHRVGTEHLVALAGADHHEDLLRRVLPGVAERAGAGADAALHAHLDHVAFFDVGLDFLEEVVAVTFDGAVNSLVIDSIPVSLIVICRVSSAEALHGRGAELSSSSAT
jgi:hypothetical protein